MPFALHLIRGRPIPLADAGIFSRDDEGKIHFQPNPSWVLEPDHYGLGSMDLLELEDLPEVEDESNRDFFPEQGTTRKKPNLCLMQVPYLS